MIDDEAVIAEVELCSTCHSAELIEDSRIAEAGWKAEITKMRNWGAAVPEDKATPFALWFARHYPAGERPPPPRTITTKDAIAAVAPESGARAVRGDKQAGAAIYTKDCASCHGADAQGTGGGPVLIEAPVLYQPQRFTALTKQGKGRMPAFDVLRKDDINNLIAYLRDLR
jgi:mono/diheme cytochrome c family protein